MNIIHKYNFELNDNGYFYVKNKKMIINGKEITECIGNIELHICSCVLCKKKYKFSNIDKHACYKNT